MSYMLNKMFQATTAWQRVYWRGYMASHMSVEGAQKMLVKDLSARE